MQTESQQAGTSVAGYADITQQLLVRELGTEDYTTVWQAMQQFTFYRKPVVCTGAIEREHRTGVNNDFRGTRTF